MSNSCTVEDRKFLEFIKILNGSPRIKLMRDSLEKIFLVVYTHHWHSQEVVDINVVLGIGNI